MRGRAAACLLLALAALLGAPAALAIPADLRLDQLHHTRWTVADGAPAVARAMAQSSDGALWIGTSDGLYRFDGVLFERIQAPDKSARPLDSVSALMSMPDGSLWIGLRYGSAYHLKAGRFIHHAEEQGLPAERVVFKFALTHDGRVWAGTSDGLFALEGGRWRRVGTEFGLAHHMFHDLAVDRDGSLWASTNQGVWRLSPDAQRAWREHAGQYFGHLAALKDGSVWYTPVIDRSSKSTPNLLVLRPAPGQSHGAGMRMAEWAASPIIGDRDGGLWTVQLPGIVRLPRPAALRRAHSANTPPMQAQRFGSAQGMSGDDISYLFEDREGNVWASTVQGLDRFRVPKVRRTLEAPTSGLRAASDGSLLVCSHGDNAARDADGPIELLRRAGPLCDALTTEPSGRSWWVLGKRLWWLQDSRAGVVPWPPEALPVLAAPAIQVDGTGALWVSLIRQGIFRYHHGRWTHFLPDSKALQGSRPLAIGRDQAGRIWFGYRDGNVLMLDGEHQRSWSPTQGLEVGNVMSLAAHRGAMLIGGSEGLALIDGHSGRIAMLQGEDGERFRVVTGLVIEGSQAWIQTVKAIFRVSLEELDRAAADSRARIRADRFDDADGLRGLASAEWPWPTATRTGDGRLWFSTTAATFALDPKDVAQQRRPPPVELRGWTVGSEAADLQPDRALPIGTRRIELRYAAIDISQPQRVRYRYRLEGLDADWQATTARSATYTNLPPGEYRFRVAAASGHGPWSEHEATLRFTIPPAFYQAAWFYALCAAAAAAFAWGLYRLRIRRLTTRLRLRAEAQAQERERIARNLHDTLLQSVQGLVLGVQALAARTPDDHPEKARIERVLARADEAVREGRRKVLELRSDEDTDLADWLSDLACELSERGPAAVSVRSEGEPRALRAELREQAMHIGHEAMVNAQKHARAATIELLLRYGPEAFVLEVADDGIGMRAGLMDGSEATPAHWGLAGMRERAAALGARLRIERRGGDGRTVVRLEAPAALAYAAPLQTRP